MEGFKESPVTSSSIFDSRRKRILKRGKGMVVGRVGIEVEWCERRKKWWWV
jgi:hypothetical protein